MKYEKGDKFIIEIESRVNSQGLYNVKGFRTFALTFDDNSLDRLEQVRDRCDGCKYEHLMGDKNLVRVVVTTTHRNLSRSPKKYKWVMKWSYGESKVLW